MKKDKAFVFSHPFLEIKKQNPNMQKEQIRADNKTKHKERDNLRQKLGETVKCSLNPQTNVGKSDPVGVSGQRTKLERRFENPYSDEERAYVADSTKKGRKGESFEYSTLSLTMGIYATEEKQRETRACSFLKLFTF